MTEESVQQIDVKEMSKTERRELRKIVSRRFRLLRNQLQRRERELRAGLTKQIREERESNVKKITAKTKALVDRQNKLAEAYEKLYSEASELGVVIDLPSPVSVDLETLKGRYGRDAIRAATNKEVDERMAVIKEEAGWGKLNLDEIEWKLDEQLAVGELESGTAKEFLKEIPTVEALLPLPAGVTLEIES